MTHKLDKGPMIKVEVKVMLHNEERRLIIQALNGHIPVKEIAECFSVNTSTIYRLRKQMEMTGSVETRTSLRERKPYGFHRFPRHIPVFIYR